MFIARKLKTIVQQGSKLNQTTAPIITLPTIASITDVGMTVGAAINTGGESTVWSVEYGLTNAYGSTATGGTITEETIVTKALTGLTQNTLYHWRIKAVNSKGTTYTEDQTATTTNVRWIIPITGQTSGTATAGIIVITCSEDITPTVTGDVTMSIAAEADSTYRKQTITINCSNNGSGTLIIPDRSKVISLGNHKGTSDPDINFYTGIKATSPIVAWNFDDIPSTVTKIYQSSAYSNILPGLGTANLPSGLTYLLIIGPNINWTNANALPTGLTFFKFSSNNFKWSYSGALPTGLIQVSLEGTNAGLTWSYSGALPTGLTYINFNGQGLNWTGLDIPGTGNITGLNLLNYRQTKMSSTDMVTLLTNLTNRVGALPATITINDYADYASPPQSVIDAVAALKTAKSITTVNLGA